MRACVPPPGSAEGQLFVNTRVAYTAETCTSCVNSGTGWVTPVAEENTADLYTATKEESFFVAGVEDFEVAVDHGGLARWGQRKQSEYYGTSFTMNGALLGKDGANYEDRIKTYSDKASTDLIKVSDLLKAAGASKLCPTADACDADSSRYAGATLLVELRYKNRVTWGQTVLVDDLDYTYRAVVLEELSAATKVDIYPDLSGGNLYGYKRVRVERFGLNIAFRVTGAIGRFSFERLWIAFASGCFAFLFAQWLFRAFLRWCVPSRNLNAKLSMAFEASKEIFIYSASANKLEDGTYGAPSAKAMLKPEVEMSDYQKRKGIQRKLSRTRMDDGTAFNTTAMDMTDGDDWDGPSGAVGGGSLSRGAVGGGRALRKPVPIGTKIKRTFPGFGVYEGTVVEYSKPFYRVVYPDGDAEQLLGKELRPLIQASHV